MKMDMQKLDSAHNSFFARELEHIKSQTYDIKYPALKARQFIPTDNSGHPGSTSITYQQWDKVGRAKIIANNAKDIPRADAKGAEFNRPVREVALSYGYTVKEVRSAMMAGGTPLSARKAASTRKGIEDILDEVAAIGAPDYGILDGFLNNSNVSATGVGGGNDWPTLAAGTDAQRRALVQQVADSYIRIVSGGKDIWEPDTLIISPERRALISTVPFGDNSDKTILDFMLANFDWLKNVESWYRNTDAGAATTQRMVIYNRSPEVLTQDIVSEYEQLPVQEEGLEFVTYTMASTAGTAIYYPKSVDYTDEI